MWLLVGCSPNVEVAQYTLQVLLRLMARARAEHIKAKLKRCGPKNKTARADAFCQGWVAAIASRTPHGVLGRSEGCNRGPHAAESPEPGKVHAAQP